MTTDLAVRPVPRGPARSRPRRLTASEVRTIVRHRDGYQCRICGMTARKHVRLTGKTLDVHRLNPGSKYTVSGCISVCRDCHGKLPKSAPGTVRGGVSRFNINPQLYQQLRVAAAQSRRTLTAELEVALEFYLAHLKLWPASPPTTEDAPGA